MVTLAATIAVVATALAVTVPSASSHEKDVKIAVGRWWTLGHNAEQKPLVTSIRGTLTLS